jgi:hypothetical protein
LEEVDLTVNADADKEVLDGILKASRKSAVPVSQEDARRMLIETELWKFAFWRKAVYLATVLLVISSWVALDLRRQVTNLKNELELAREDVPPTPPDDTTTINLYLKEHQDVVARHASFGQPSRRPLQMQANQQDVMYYEHFDDGPKYVQPGIIVRGPLAEREITPSKAPVISNGHTLTLSEARATAGFNLVSPAWLPPAFALDQIRRIEGRDALQLLYTNEIISVSLFEQPLDGQRGLEADDFREYAVYQQKGQAGGAILAWRDHVRSYALIGNVEISQLMDMAQSINAAR